ncbi:type I restriction-modification system subunit M [Streptomyces sp. N2-109]|uniref:site-specific DNA-methyltransferase (adenine-specific) n=1 Tax=Streptomyces gossypii TaxID=2883101 RepID=A0ABT2JSR8_9ACTN|nr:class I SAM-dependent DNA methyltransferase [Streptomyces gossypii]MCT2590881.1 type I restriction-modification system subunit M [Streptomyces gossypii]
MNSSKHQELVSFIWSVADLLRGDYKQSEYGKVVLPFTVLRRLDCVLEPTKDAVIEEHRRWFGKPMDTTRLMEKAAKQSFYNTSKLTLRTAVADPAQVRKNLTAYVGAFSENAREILDKYEFDRQLMRLEEAGLLYQVAGKFAEVDLHPDRVSNHQMGYVFEDLIRRFSEQSNETAGEHFTPREVIRLMVNLLLAPDEDGLTVPGVVRTILDPACGTGGMLTEAEEHITQLNPNATVQVFGQELNAESYAICRSDLMIKGQPTSNIVFGDSFREDGHGRKSFDYLLANPPFGVEWKKAREEIEYEHNELGWAGRFGAGLPRINDGSLLFLQHMIKKMKPVEDGGGRIAIVFNGSPLFTGAAESGESRIRQWILENDLLEGIVALPDQLFYNTGISTYFWILTNRKVEGQKGKVVLLDAREHFAKMRKSLGDKRKYVTDEQIAEITRLYRDSLTVAEDAEHPLHGKVKVFRNRDFGYHRITVERPLKLRFEVTEEGLAELEATMAGSKTLAKYETRAQLLDALRTLVGQPASVKRVEFADALRSAYAENGVDKLPANVDKAVWSVVAVRDADGEVQKKRGGVVEPDAELRDNENVPLDENVDAYVEREVLPHVPDAWVDHSKTKVGYEIPFTRHFYVYKPPRPLSEIDAELKALEGEIQALLGEVTE